MHPLQAFREQDQRIGALVTRWTLEAPGRTGKSNDRAAPSHDERLRLMARSRLDQFRRVWVITHAHTSREISPVEAVRTKVEVCRFREPLRHGRRPIDWGEHGRRERRPRQRQWRLERPRCFSTQRRWRGGTARVSSDTCDHSFRTWTDRQPVSGDVRSLPRSFGAHAASATMRASCARPSR